MWIIDESQPKGSRVNLNKITSIEGSSFGSNYYIYFNVEKDFTFSWVFNDKIKRDQKLKEIDNLLIQQNLDLYIL